MDPGLKKMGGLAVILLGLALLLSTASAQSSPCSFNFSGNREYATCLSLPQLDSYLHWTYDATTATADVAFRATRVIVSSTGNWVAWAINPTGSGMIGAQALVAFQSSNGSISAYTSSVLNTTISTLEESPLSFTVSELTSESNGGSSGQIIIFAKIQVPRNKTFVNHVWQVGPLTGGTPAEHPLTPDHISSFGSFDFLSGSTSDKAPPVDSSPVPATMTPPAQVDDGSSSFSLTKESVVTFVVTLCLLPFLLWYNL